jgi:hypothetical protein
VLDVAFCEDRKEISAPVKLFMSYKLGKEIVQALG